MATTRFRTALCDMLGIDLPVMLAAMAPDISDPKLVAAVSEAGGIGVLACASQASTLGVISRATKRRMASRKAACSAL